MQFLKVSKIDFAEDSEFFLVIVTAGFWHVKSEKMKKNVSDIFRRKF